MPARKQSTQSQKKRTRDERRSQSESEEEHFEEEDGIQSSQGDVEKLAHKLVRLALANEYTRKPLKRETINKLVLGNQARLIHDVIFAANDYLKKVFGMELVQLRQKNTKSTESQTQKTQEKSQDPSKKKSGPTSNLWILRSTIKNVYLDRLSAVSFEDEEDTSANDGGPVDREAMEWREWIKDEGIGLHSKTNDQRSLMGILHVILSIILLNGRVMSEPELYKHLKRLGLTNDTILPLDLSAPRRESITLGVFLSQLQRQQYLDRRIPAISQRTQKSQTQARNEAEALAAIEWRWGPRAEAEIGEKLIAKKFMIEFILPPLPSGQDTDKEAVDEVMKHIAKAAGGDLSDARKVVEK